MKLIKFICFGVLLSASIVSCSKDDDDPVDLGNTLWIDSANVNGVAYKPFTLLFKSDGSATVTFNGLSPYNGSWNKPPTKDSVFFFFDESSTTKWKGAGKLNGNKIEGTLTKTTPSTLTGTFRVTKQ